ncbi:hypothetical protein IP88_13955 [alpha proteobacterium AAP81b]|nr:hypothetical protein IP88_13955 [alpha proteobacterium AAP81b]
MGPAATVDFLQRLVAGVGAARDRDHPRVLVDSNPYVPDRNAARAGGPSPGPALAAMALGLVDAGAEVLAMPCNAAHGWAGDIVAAIAGRARFVSIVEAAVAAVGNARRVGILAVGATLDAGLYHAPLLARGIGIVDGDLAVVQPLVNRIKAGDTGAEVQSAMRAEALRLVTAGAEAIVAACTEVPLVLRQADLAVPLIDTSACLAMATLAAARR